MVRVGLFDFLPMAEWTKVLNLEPVLDFEDVLLLWTEDKVPVRRGGRSLVDFGLDHHEDLLEDGDWRADMAERREEERTWILLGRG